MTERNKAMTFSIVAWFVAFVVVPVVLEWHSTSGKDLFFLFIFGMCCWFAFILGLLYGREIEKLKEKEGENS